MRLNTFSYAVWYLDIFFGEVLVHVSCPFSIELPDIHLLIYSISSHILDRSPSLVKYITTIFFHFVSSLCSLYYDEQKLNLNVGKGINIFLYAFI